MAINANSGNDSVIIAGNINITGDINGGNNTDTLTFSMAVPGGNIQALQLALNSANPALGSIIINGQTYSWLNFESINHNLSVRVHSIPTLSEWAILLLIALLGFIGFKRTNEHRSSPKT